MPGDALGLTGSRDHQRGAVYAWENRKVALRNHSTIAFASCQSMVDAIWPDMGLRYPPAVERLSRKATATIALKEQCGSVPVVLVQSTASGASTRRLESRPEYW